MSRVGLPWALAVLLLASPVLAQDGTVDIEHLAIQARGHLGLARPKASGTPRVIVGGLGALISDSGYDRELAETAGIDAAALGFDDLEAAAAHPDLLRPGKVPFVCANVVEENSGKHVVPTHVVARVGGRRIAFVGVTKPTREFKPPKGWRIDEPAAVLKILVPALAKEAETVVILAVMDRLEAASLLKQSAGIAAMIVPARGINDPEALKVGEGWLVQSPDGAAGRL
ncbi:MAG TPA: hypothetical protein VJB14_00955, partial [Planctomycetota bacterium]|nr:hypothetical protein [Planctomycetota bacterium]